MGVFQIMEEKNFECIDCGKKIKTSGKTPECCGKSMKQVPLDLCNQSANAEQARPMETEEPCDDGRAG
jgi:hypothetical protein